MRYMVILLFAITSCASSPVASKQAKLQNKPVVWKVYKFTERDISGTVASALYLMGEQLDTLNGWKILLNAGYMQVPHPTDPRQIYLADGVTVKNEKKIYLFAYRDCLADSALVHELFHAVGRNPYNKDRQLEVKLVEQKLIWLRCPNSYRAGGPIPTPDMIIEVVSDPDIDRKGLVPIGKTGLNSGNK